MTEDEGTKKQLGLDFILEEIVGGGGLWQWRTTFIVFPLMWISAYPLFLSIFAAYIPKHRCYVDACEGDPKISDLYAPWTEFAIPDSESREDALDEALPFDACHKFLFRNESDSECAPDSFNVNITETCDGRYVFDRSQMTRTLATDLELVCDNEYKTRLLGSVIMVGLFIGSWVGGKVCDHFGRKKSIFIGAFIIIPCVFLGGAVVNFYVYFILRLVTCIALPIMWISGHTYGLEYFSPKYRKLMICVKDIPIAGYLLALLVYYNRDWRHLHFWTGTLCLVGLPAYFLIPESPRWLAANGRVDEAERVFLDIAKGNRRVVSPEQRKQMSSILERVDLDADPELSWYDMLQPGYRLSTFVMLLTWICVCVTFYVLALSSTELHGDIALNYLLATIAETPISIFLYFTLDSIGRKATLIITLGLLGGSCLGLAIIPKHFTGFILIVYIVGRTAGSMGFVMVFLVTAEIYPTNLRAQAIGVCSMVSRVFGMSASFVTKLSVWWSPLPMIVLAVPNMAAAAFVLLLPETRGCDLPQNLAEKKSDESKLR